LPFWPNHSPPRPTKSSVPAKPQKARPQDQCPACKNTTRSHRPTYYIDSSVRRVFKNQAFLSPGQVSVLPSNGRFTFTSDGQLKSDTHHIASKKIHKALTSVKNSAPKKKVPQGKPKPGPRSKRRIHIGSTNAQWLPWRVLASTGPVLRSTHFFSGTMGTVYSTHGYDRVL
jgi:hypothetical protein